MLFVSIFTPISLAFVGPFESEIVEWNFILDLIINASFFIDLILTFFSAYENKKLEIIDKRKVRESLLIV